jgi:hypothetical protein
MGWMRTLNRLDTAYREADIRALRNKHWEGAKALDEKAHEFDRRQNELGRQAWRSRL